MRRLIAEGSTAQAIAIGRHILGLHPKHLQTYQILGEACLEQGDLDDAHGLFARALACDPENLFARVGIAVAHEKRGNESLAIWHMERAYELTPGNTELRKEMQRLYAQRDGAARGKLKLTQGAVARLYARSGLSRQAIQEFRAILEQNPDLLDVKVALADALWNAGEKKDAAKICQEILSKYPHCLKANLILGEIGLRGERESEGRALLQLAQEIDPENTMAQKLFGDRSPLPARTVKVPRLQDLPTPPDTGEVTVYEEEIAEEPLPAWLSKTPLKPGAEAAEEKAKAPAEEEEVILAPEGEEMAAPESKGATEESKAVEEMAGDTEEGIPDWLQRIRERQKQDVQPEAEQEESSEDVEKAAPDWIKRLREEDMVVKAPAEEALPEVPAESAAAVPEAPAEEAVPDWLKQLEADAESKSAEVEPQPEPEEKREPLPDWLTAPAVAAGAAIAGAALAGEETPLPEGEAVELEALPARTETPVAGEPAPAEVPAEAMPEQVAPQEVAKPAPVESPVESSLETAAPQEVVAAEAEQAPIEVSAEPAAEMAAPQEVIAETAEQAPAEVLAEPAPETPAVQENAPQDAIAEVAQAAEVVAAAPVAPEQLLAQARELRDSANADGALDLYEKMVKDGQMLDKVLADLEGGLAGPLAQPRTYTLIGDLCMKQERLQKALEAYRRALDLLKK
jgi:tetratricopeptide (TPR) repeat protein